MSELPGNFKWWQEHYGGKIPDFMCLQPFLYDHESKSFLIGKDKQTLAVTDFDPYTYNDYGREEQAIREIEELTQHPALLQIVSGPIVTPRLHGWVQEAQNEFAEQTVRLMHDVYSMFYEEPIPFETGGGFMSFEAGVRQDGAIGLQVLGNCACFGPKYSTGMFEEGVEHGFAEYELHNADSQAQRISLYAGLGHLAKLAAEADS